MPTPTIPHSLFSKLLNVSLILILSTSLGACMGDDNPVGPAAPAPDTTTDPEVPAGPAYYDVTIDLSHFKIITDCDPGPTQGGGEFVYTIVIHAQDHSEKYQLVKKITGSFEGGNGSSHNLGRVQRFRLREGLKYYVGVKATERDGFANDDDYVGYKQDVNKAGGQLLYNHVLTIGKDSCKLSLTYTAEEVLVD